MRFLTKIEMNGEVVAKGFGPNKKIAKSTAANILLQTICPKIYSEFMGNKSRDAKASGSAKQNEEKAPVFYTTKES